MAVGDVAGKGVFVPHAVVSLEGGEEFVRLAIADGGGALAAVARHDGERVRMRLEETRYILAASLFEMSQHGHLGLESLLRVEPAEGFFHPPVEPDMHPGELRVFANHGGASYGLFARRATAIPAPQALF